MQRQEDKTIFRDVHEMQKLLKQPGEIADPPEQIIEELKEKFNQRNQKQSDLNFFGGQPVSLNKTYLNSKIFKVEQTQRRDIIPTNYIICQKTDGVRFLLIITGTKGHNYFMSRLQGKGNKPVFYRADSVQISTNYDYIQRNPNQKQYFQNIVEILDGQLCIDTYKDSNNEPYYKLRYLVFDILVHHKVLITKLPLIERLTYAELFVKSNSFGLQFTHHSSEQSFIDIQMKDFFEIIRSQSKDRDPKIIKFMFEKYIPSLPHENDGIIFNDKGKQYLLGTNEGYLKWKPMELNTVDFLGVPNTKFDEDQFKPYRAIDLYLRLQNKETNTYSQLFEAFLLVDQETYENIQKTRSDKTQQQGEYVQGIVLQCNYIKQDKSLLDAYNKLYDHNEDYFLERIMNSRTDQAQMEKLKKLKLRIFQKFWNILRIRDDRSAGNNADVAEKIMKTIDQDIKKEDLIKTSFNYFKTINDLIREKELSYERH